MTTAPFPALPSPALSSPAVPPVPRARPPAVRPRARGSPARLAALAGRQAGVVSRAQALGTGLDPAEVDRNVARRRWRPLHPRVYLVAGYPPTDEARVRAAVLWAGEGAVVAGAAALWWHAPAGPAPETVTVAAPHHSAVARPGVAVRRRTLGPAEVVQVRGLAVTVRPLALLDAAVEAGGVLPRRSGGDRARLRALAGGAGGPASARRLLAAPAVAGTPAGTSSGGIPTARPTRLVGST